MADDLKNKGAPDRSRINVHEEHEVRYWTKKFGISDAALKKVVEEVGVSVEAVSKRLGRTSF